MECGNTESTAGSAKNLGECSARELGTCLPIFSIDELINWKLNEQSSHWRDYAVNKAPTTDHKIAGFGMNCHIDQEINLTRLIGNSTPKTIFCHDFKGGYLEDRYPNGVQKEDIYSFFHWSAIDIFVYFSHHIVSIPTLSWLNAGHRHGCKVLGTFITEFDEGVEIWRRIFADDVIFSTIIDNLVNMCQYFRFDGYLLNIENDIQTEHVPRLMDFVRILTEKLHSVSPDYEVIWYDSVVTPVGKLKWQNKLNNLNRKFFDLCDGIFLNYTWKEEDLAESVSYAGLRKHDVYVGIDVFGRSFIGGGGFNTCEAMKLIHKYDLSYAIFAPAWTYEMCPENENFLSREILFWNTIWPYLFVHGPVLLPFITTFCIGRGKNRWFKGRRIGSEWGCLNDQEYQLSTCYCAGREEEINVKASNGRNGCLQIFTEESFTGGTCLHVDYSSNSNVLRLLTCGFTSSSHIEISFTFKSTAQENAQLALVLYLEYKSHLRQVFFAPDPYIRASMSSSNNEFRKSNEVVKPKNVKTEKNGWITNTFHYNLNERTIIEINCVHLGQTPVLLGQLSIQKLMKR